MKVMTQQILMTNRVNLKTNEMLAVEGKTNKEAVEGKVCVLRGTSH